MFVHTGDYRVYILLHSGSSQEVKEWNGLFSQGRAKGIKPLRVLTFYKGRDIYG